MKLCDCSRPAVKKMDGDWVCQVCSDLGYSYRYQQRSAGVAASTASPSQLDWETYWTDGLNWGRELVKMERRTHA